MRGEIQDLSVGIKDLLCAVAMMQIPIDNQDFFNIMYLSGMHCANGDIVENTKSRGISCTRVMPGRANQGKSADSNGLERASGGEKRRLVGRRRDHRIGIDEDGSPCF